VFCTAKYRGGVRKDGGVNPYKQKSYPIFSIPLLKNYRFVGISPITNATRTREKKKYNPSHLLKFKFIPHEFSTEPYPTRYKVISPSYKKLCPDLTTGAQTYN